MSFARLIHDYIDEFAAFDRDVLDERDDRDHRDPFEDFDDDIDGDESIHDRHARRHRRSSRGRSRRLGRGGRASRSRGSGHRSGGSTRDLVRLVVLTAVAISVIRRLRAGRRRSHRREYA